MRAAGNDVVDQILMRNLEPTIDDRHLDSGSANAERVQDVHIQIDAWPWPLVAEHRLALIEQMPLVAQQRIGAGGFRFDAVCRVGACSGVCRGGASHCRCCSQHRVRRVPDQQCADQCREPAPATRGRWRERTSSRSHVRLSRNGEKAHFHWWNRCGRVVLGSPVRVDAADVAGASAPATVRVGSGNSVPAMPAIHGACVTHRTPCGVFARLRFAREVFRRKFSATFSTTGRID